MQSSIIKEIRSIDKSLRESIKGLPLFKVNFRLLRDLEEQRVVEIRDWYLKLQASEAYLSLMKLYRENKPDYWIRVQKRFPNLPEYGKLQYRLQVFVATARQTMPDEINPKVIALTKEADDLSNTNS